MFKMAEFFGTAEQASEWYNLERFGDLWYHIAVGKCVNGVCDIFLFF